MTDLMSTREVARYLGVNEKKVYFLAKAGKIPCTRVTGKWTFPKKLIDQWIEESASGLLKTKSKSKERSFLLAAGSEIRASGFCVICSSRKRSRPRFSWGPAAAAVVWRRCKAER